MRLQPDEARSAPLQVSALQDVVCARLPESRTPEVWFGFEVSKGQQARQATALVGQTRKPRPFPRRGERAAGAGVASSPSGFVPISVMPPAGLKARLRSGARAWQWRCRQNCLMYADVAALFHGLSSTTNENLLQTAASFRKRVAKRERQVSMSGRPHELFDYTTSDGSQGSAITQPAQARWRAVSSQDLFAAQRYERAQGCPRLRYCATRENGYRFPRSEERREGE